jgi:S-adenosyl-L-methionine hydrolase (adenosine-forming)
MNRIITLTTDFGNRDHYVGSMKGVIYSINPDAIITDITHEIPFHDVFSAAFNLRGFIPYFPKETINLVVVDPGVGSSRKPIALEADEKFFVGPDNGVFTYVILESESFRAYEISNPKYFLPDISFTFHGRDIFAPVTAHLSLGVSIEDLGERLLDPLMLEIKEPEIGDREIAGEVIFEDTFGNLITNIPGSMVDSDSRLHVSDIVINGVCKSYSEASEGELLAVIGSSGFLELSVNRGRASDLIKCSSRKVYVRNN